MFQYSHVYDVLEEVCISRNDIKVGKKYEELELIASWCLCNTASLNVFKVNGEVMLVAINDNSPQWYDIDNHIDEDWKDKDLEDEYNLGIEFGGSTYFLDECMRV